MQLAGRRPVPLIVQSESALGCRQPPGESHHRWPRENFGVAEAAVVLWHHGRSADTCCVPSRAIAISVFGGIVTLAILESIAGSLAALIFTAAVVAFGLAASPLRALSWLVPVAATLVLILALTTNGAALLFVPASVLLFTSVAAALAGHLVAELRDHRSPGGR